MKKKDTKSKPAWVWIVKIFAITIALATVMSFLAEVSLRNLSLPLAFLALIIFIFMGVFFDTIGVAIATATPTPFVAMSSKRVKGAKEGLYLLQRAEIVTNICNDVIGDICGIVSGAAGAIIVATLISMSQSLQPLVISVIASAVIAALTVSGKALGKTLAMRNNKDIVLATGRFIHLFTKIWSKENEQYLK